MSRLTGTVLQSAEAIRERVGQLGREITRDFEGRDLMVLGVLNGSFIFLADLVRHIALPLDCGFIQVRKEDTGLPATPLSFTLTLPVEGRSVLLVEDILDTGTTLDALVRGLSARRPAQIATCVLLDKPARRRVDLRPDYVGFTVPDVWVVGYGLDHEGLYRNLPHLTSVETSRELS